MCVVAFIHAHNIVLVAVSMPQLLHVRCNTAPYDHYSLSATTKIATIIYLTYDYKHQGPQLTMFSHDNGGKGGAMGLQPQLILKCSIEIFSFQ